MTDLVELELGGVSVSSDGFVGLLVPKAGPLTHPIFQKWKMLLLSMSFMFMTTEKKARAAPEIFRSCVCARGIIRV
jgi:hypothetical protein